MVTDTMGLYGAACRTTGKRAVRLVANPTKKTLIKFMSDFCIPNPGAIAVFTDGWPGYFDLASLGYHHEYTNHNKKQYAIKSAWHVIHKQAAISKGRKKAKRAKGCVVHSNSVENMWRQLRAGLVGTYRNISLKYLLFYASETAFRLDELRVSRDIGSRVASLYKHGIGKTITYRQLKSA